MAGPYLVLPSLMPCQIRIASSSRPHSCRTAPSLNSASSRTGVPSAADLKPSATLVHSPPDRPPDFFADM